MVRRYTIGIDFGGTHVRAGLVRRRGGVTRFCTSGSRAGEGPEGPIEAITEAVAELCAETNVEVVGVGVGSPGVIDPATGSLIGRTPHLPHWEDFPLRARLAERLGLPVSVDNDANLAALGEHRCGAARGAQLSLTVTVGTGVGCGIVAGGRVVRGAWGGAGEIGHLPLGDGTLDCRCGIERCVEPDMSGSGVARHAERLGLGERDAERLFVAAAEGDPDAEVLVARLGDRLGAAIAVAVNLLNPEVVVVGGGVGLAGEALLARVREAVGRYALESHRRRLRLASAELGARAGVVGAGLMAWESPRIIDRWS